MGVQVGGETPEVTDAGVATPRRRVARLVARASWPVWLALGFLLLFALLTVLTFTGALEGIDTSVVHRLRPMDRWGESQERYIPWMSRFSPSRMYLLLGATSLAMAVWRRSWWPLLFGTALAGATVTLTVLVKFAFGRGDPHGYVTTTGGSYPSGHMIAVVACLGGCLLVVWPRVRWWLWVPLVAAASLMASALLVSAVHWLTDVVGGVLLALAVVSAASRSPVRRRACRPASAAWFGMPPRRRR